MATLLSIPPEIQDQIFEFVILSPIAEPPPLEPLHHLVADRKELDDVALSSWTNERDIYYLNKPQLPAVAPLLLVNRQIHAQVKSILGRANGVDDYELDVAIVGDARLYPTWIRLPRLTERVGSVKATFRIACRSVDALLFKRRNSYSGFRIGDGAGPAIAWVVYALLERFLRVGPVGERSGTGSGESRSVSLRTLEIDVQTPPGVDDVELFTRPRVTYSQRTPVVGTFLDPKYLVRFVEDEIGSLLRMSYHTASYGKMLYENIGQITVTLDGEEVRTWDLGEKLRALKYTDSFSRNEQKFNEWKEFVVPHRESKGLAVYIDI